MPTPADFLQFSQWSLYATLGFLGLTILGFLVKWGIRFRLVGATGFMGVLTAGLFALSIVPFTRTVIPGSIRFSNVYDNGATRAVIVVPSSITETELEATLRQAADDLFSPGRLSLGRDPRLTIVARTILHPEPGVSQPLPLGQVRRSLSVRDDDQMEIEIYRDNLAQLPPPAESNPT